MAEVIGNVGAVAYDIVSQDKTSAGANSASKSIGKMSLAIGASMTAIGVGAKLMADDINETYLSFDSAMANVKSLGGVTLEQYDLMREGAIELSKELPLSAEEVASGMYMMRSAGYDANKTLAEMPAIADMAVAGQLEMADAVNATTAVLDAYGTKAGDGAHVTDVLMGTVQDFKTTLPELQMEMAKNIGVAANLGIGFEELSVMNGMLKKDFVGSEEAGTALKTMLMKLIDPSNSAKLESYGITVRDVNGDFVGMESLLEQLSITMDEAGGSVDSMGALTEIFGTEGVRAAMSLARQKDELGPYTEAMKEGGQVQEALNAQLETTASQLEIANNKMDAAKIAMGEAMAPSTILASDAMVIFAESVEALPDGLQTLVGTGITLSEAFIGIGPLFMGIGPAMTAYSAIQNGTLIPSLWAAATAGWAAVAPWAPFIIAAVAVGAVLYILEDQFGLVTWAIDGLWSIGETLVEWLKGAFTGGLGEGSDALLLFLGPIGMVIYAFQHWDEILPIITGVFDDVKEFITGMFDWFGNAGGRLIELFVDGILNSPFSPFGAVKMLLGPVADLLPHSPAKEGPLSVMPNWEAYLTDPVMESGEAMETEMESNLDAMLLKREGQLKEYERLKEEIAAMSDDSSETGTSTEASETTTDGDGTDSEPEEVDYDSLSYEDQRAFLLNSEKERRRAEADELHEWVRMNKDPADFVSSADMAREASAELKEEAEALALSEAAKTQMAVDNTAAAMAAMESYNASKNSPNAAAHPIDQSAAEMGTITSSLSGATSMTDAALAEIKQSQAELKEGQQNLTGGDTLSIGTITVREDKDITTIFQKWEEMQRAKRIKRGLRA